ELSSRAREQHLSAVPGCADACGLMYTHTHITLLADLGLTGVQAHADAKLGAVRPLVCGEIALRVDCRRDGVLRSVESHEKGVALRIDLVSPVSGEGLAQDPLVLREHPSIEAAKPSEQRRRPFYVREEKGDGAARELGHHTSLTST